MKTLRTLALVWLFPLIVWAGSTPLSTWHSLPTPDEIDVMHISVQVRSRSLVVYMDQWVRETARRYDDFVLIVVHGKALGPVWIAASDPPYKFHTAETLVDQMREKFPERRIVLIMCNPGHIVLAKPGVTYALDLVWARPDSFVSQIRHVARDLPDNGVGDIFEFTENPF